MLGTEGVIHVRFYYLGVYIFTSVPRTVLTTLPRFVLTFVSVQSGKHYQMECGGVQFLAGRTDVPLITGGLVHSCLRVGF